MGFAQNEQQRSNAAERARNFVPFNRRFEQQPAPLVVRATSSNLISIKGIILCPGASSFRTACDASWGRGTT